MAKKRKYLNLNESRMRKRGRGRPRLKIRGIVKDYDRVRALDIDAILDKEFKNKGLRLNG